jgi:hypothetical protein
MFRGHARCQKGLVLDDVRRVGREIELIETCGPHPFTAMGRPDERMYRRNYMRTGLTRTRVLAMVALGAMMATTAEAQTRTRRTRSTTRIPVSKEPVVPDSTVRDSTPAPAPAPAPEPAPVVTRTDSTTVVTRVETPVVRRWRYGNGWYI